MNSVNISSIKVSLPLSKDKSSRLDNLKDSSHNRNGRFGSSGMFPTKNDLQAAIRADRSSNWSSREVFRSSRPN